MLRSRARKSGTQTSHYRGVSLLKQTGKWHAQINVGGKQVHMLLASRQYLYPDLRHLHLGLSSDHSAPPFICLCALQAGRSRSQQGLSSLVRGEFCRWR
jgi:hypothetical protein